MKKTPLIFALAALTFSPFLAPAQEVSATKAPPQLIDVTKFRPFSDAVVEMFALGSDKGQALLDRKAAVDYAALAPVWVPQYDSHCGAASAVVVANALNPGLRLTQDCLFIPETEHIITQDVVYRIGFTLEELEEMIRTRTGLTAARFHAGTEEGQHDFAAFEAALRKNRESRNDQLILNFAGNWFFDRKNSGGHFSPVGDYHEESGMMLIMEVNPAREKYWVSAQEMWDAMNKVDRISGLVRGWIVVEKKETPAESADGG